MPPRFRILLLTALLACPGLAHALPGIAPGNYVTEGGWGDLKIVKPPKGDLSFEIYAVGKDAAICQLSGHISKGRAVLKQPKNAKPCIVTFKPGKDGIDVSANGDACNAYCGVSAVFVGQYLERSPECEWNAIQDAKSDFRRLSDSNQNAEAIARLAPVLDHCTRFISWTDAGWIRNDLAVAQYRLGDYAGCRATLRPLKDDAEQSDDALRESRFSSGNAEMGLSIIRAARANLRLCAGRGE